MEKIYEILRKMDLKKPDTLAKCKDELAGLGNEAVPELIKILRTGNVFERWAVASALGKMNDRTAIPSLTEALKDENVSVRIMAAQSLAELGDSSGIQILVEALKDDSVLIGHPPVLAKYYADKVLQRYTKKSSTEG